MDQDWQSEMNNVLGNNGVPFICRRVVAAYEDSFFDSVLALLEDQKIEENIFGWAKGLTSIPALRKALAHFMFSNSTLHTLESFILQREITLKIENLSWQAYLDKVSTSKDADDLILLSMAHFVGKDIMLTSYNSTKKDPWRRIEGQTKGWNLPISTPPLTIGFLKQGHYEALKRKPPSTNDTQCPGCSWSGSRLGSHLNMTTKQCKYFCDPLHVLNVRRAKKTETERQRRLSNSEKTNKEDTTYQQMDSYAANEEILDSPQKRMAVKAESYKTPPKQRKEEPTERFRETMTHDSLKESHKSQKEEKGREVAKNLEKCYYNESTVKVVEQAEDTAENMDNLRMSNRVTGDDPEAAEVRRLSHNLELEAKQSQILKEDLSSEHMSLVSDKETTHNVKSKLCKCGICEKIFSHSGTLNRHIKHVHGGEKIHSCDKCSAHYCRKEDLENHLRKGKHYRGGICNYCEESVVFKSETAESEHFTKEPLWSGGTTASSVGKQTCVNKLKKQRVQMKEFLLGSTTCVHCNEVIPNKNAKKHWISSDVEAPEKSTCMTNLERRPSMICWYCKGEIITKDYIQQFHDNHRIGLLGRRHPENPLDPGSCHESIKRDLKKHHKKEKEIKVKKKDRRERRGLLRGEYEVMKCMEERHIENYNW